jgi:hypothetical protein
MYSVLAIWCISGPLIVTILPLSPLMLQTRLSYINIDLRSESLRPPCMATTLIAVVRVCHRVVGVDDPSNYWLGNVVVWRFY